MMTPLRQALRLMMADIPTARPPVIRRSDAEDMLLATDLPLLTDPEGTRLFLLRAAAGGWQWRERKGWLLLDHPVPVPQAPDAEPEGEAACVLLLLRKHPGGGTDAGIIRMLAKASEQGGAKPERLMRQLHGRFAVMLREKKPLPEALIPYIKAAALHERRRP